MVDAPWIRTWEPRRERSYSPLALTACIDVREGDDLRSSQKKRPAWVIQAGLGKLGVGSRSLDLSSAISMRRRLRPDDPDEVLVAHDLAIALQHDFASTGGSGWCQERRHDGPRFFRDRCPRRPSSRSLDSPGNASRRSTCSGLPSGPCPHRGARNRPRHHTGDRRSRRRNERCPNRMWGQVGSWMSGSMSGLSGADGWTRTSASRLTTGYSIQSQQGPFTEYCCTRLP